MRLRNLFILLIVVVSYAYGQNSNVSVSVSKSGSTLSVQTPTPMSTGGSPSPVQTPTATPVPANTTFRGKVFYEDDKTPVRRSIIMFFNFKDRDDQAALTDEKGRFELKNVKAGIYYPLISAPGVINFFSNIDFSKIDHNEQVVFAEAARSMPSFTADGKTDLQIEIPVKRGGAISGKVTYADGKPAIGSPIQIFRKVDGKLQPVISDFIRLYVASALSTSSFQTDDKGIYRFAGLPAGEYYISVSEPVFHVKNSNAYPFRGPDYAMSLLFGGNSFLNTFFPNTVEIKNAQPVKVELGKERADADITIPDWKLFNISGKVVSAKGGKPVKARVYAVDAASTIVKMPDTPRFSRTYSQTDENGNWTFSNIPRGRYTILIEPVDENNEYAARMAANAANAVVNAINESQRMSNTASNRISNASVGNSVNRIPKPKYAKTSYDIVVENSDVENVSVKADIEAAVKGVAEFDVQATLYGNIIIEVFNEAGVSVGTEFLSLYDSPKYLGKSWKRSFSIDNLPKGKFKMKVTIRSGNVFLKSATLNGIDLQQDSFQISAGQTLSNFKLSFGTKKQ